MDLARIAAEEREAAQRETRRWTPGNLPAVDDEDPGAGGTRYIVNGGRRAWESVTVGREAQRAVRDTLPPLVGAKRKRLISDD